MRSWSGIAEADEDHLAPFHQGGHPTVMAVNGLIAVGTENGWVAVINFKQELQRVCGTEAMGQSAEPRSIAKADMVLA